MEPKAGRRGLLGDSYSDNTVEYNSKTMLVDGKLIARDLYPPNFDFRLIGNINCGDVEKAKDYNKIALEWHLVDKT
jgi:hypothetical protein